MSQVIANPVCFTSLNIYLLVSFNSSVERIGLGCLFKLLTLNCVVIRGDITRLN